MTYSIDPPWKLRRRVKKFINNLPLNTKRWLLNKMRTYDIRNRIQWLLLNAFDIAITGALLMVAIRWLQDPVKQWISYGLIAYFVQYYLKWLIVTIKKPYNNLSLEEESQDMFDLGEE